MGMRFPEEEIQERMEDKSYNADRGFDEENPRRFYWVPLAFLALPLALLLSFVSPFFKSGSIVYVYTATDGTGVSGDAVSGMDALLHRQGPVMALLILSLAFACLIAVYGIFASFIPALRRFNRLAPVVTGLSLAGAASHIAGFIVFLNEVDKVTLEVLTAQGKEGTGYFPSAFASVGYWICFLIPGAFALWWVLVCLRQLRLFSRD